MLRGRQVCLRRFCTSSPLPHADVDDGQTSSKRIPEPEACLEQLKKREALKEKKKMYRENNKEVLRALDREYYIKNKEAIQQRNKEYKLQNKTAILEKNREYREKNKKTISEKNREYRLKKKAEREPKPPKEKKPKAQRQEAIAKRSWKTPEQVREFFESVKEQLHIATTEDWYRVSQQQLLKVGGRAVFTFGSIGHALKYAYPEIDWDINKFSFRGKKSGQRWLKVILAKLLPQGTEIYEDFLHPDLFWCTRWHIWVPQYNLALEYQDCLLVLTTSPWNIRVGIVTCIASLVFESHAVGEQHYFDVHEAYGPSGTTALYKERDIKKKQACLQNGITLASIPYWWDGSEDSLAATLHTILPCLFPKIDSMAIPTEPPTKSGTKQTGNHSVASFMMHGREWHQDEHDPTNWIISEKLDGSRAFWDGSNLFSKTGTIIPVPLELLNALPKDIKLDGELWAGYESFPKLLSILKTSLRYSKSEDEECRRLFKDLWNPIMFYVFDAPKKAGNYEERHAYAGEIVSTCDPEFVQLIPIRRCLGLEHLFQELQQVTDRKGEGLMLYHPDSPYISGRTSLLLKVKAYREEDVKFLSCNPNSYTFFCEQLNGATCIVKCSGWDYENPPPAGTVVTVKHMGFHEKSKKMRYPFLLRVRPELVWEDLKAEFIVEQAERNNNTERPQIQHTE